MFDKLQIRRFRHNKKLDVNLHPITVFRGPSGSGKSSLMGALRWLAFNTPTGKGFIHWGCVSSAVRLTEKKISVTRKRSKTENYYQINKEKYKAFRTGVPVPVADLLSISPLNFQRQHASPFWFSKTAGEVSRELNRIVNLDLIDTTLSNLDKEAKKTNNLTIDIRNRIKKAEQQKEKYAFVLPINKRLKKIEKGIDEYIEKIELIEYLHLWIGQATKHKRIIKRKIPNIKSLLKLRRNHRITKAQYDLLFNRITQAEELLEDIKNYEVEIKTNEKELKKLIGKRCPLCGTQQK